MTYFFKSKTESASAKIKRQLKAFSANSFDLYYVKGKDMTLSDFLSRIKAGKSNPHEIIPISFDLQKELHEKYYIHIRCGAQNAKITNRKYIGIKTVSSAYGKRKDG